MYHCLRRDLVPMYEKQSGTHSRALYEEMEKAEKLGEYENTHLKQSLNIIPRAIHQTPNEKCEQQLLSCGDGNLSYC